MSRNRARPLSPHLTIWKWGPHMLVSILHRATGTALAIGGGLILIWWLAALASGEDAYANFYGLVVDGSAAPTLSTTIGNWLGKLVGIGLSWSFFQHLCSGIRHLILDMGAGYELRTNKQGAIATMLISILLTALFWAYLLGVKA
jgi:succinate dehydrogenase / fumarate reductase, cytochrome b subunit